ncbi:MAG: dihydrodipicolinate synthase family protein [Albidovulum sp.]|nr:dihydrodipicolinate synthase family protein [Albidovulum sp.]
MIIQLPDAKGVFHDYELSGEILKETVLQPDSARTVFAAAHVVADPFSDNDPGGRAALDWNATLAFRRYLAGLGLGIAEAMDTAQRGMGLDWPGALELIRRTVNELPEAVVFSGAGTDQLAPTDAKERDDVRRAYFEQIEEIQRVGGRIIIMASRALARISSNPKDYVSIYGEIISSCDEPVILHWLGEMFDPALAGYWGSDSFEECLETATGIIEENKSRVDGIKISLLDKNKEILMRRQLPEGVKMYSGDDFNYPELILGDDEGYSHALLGIFDPLAASAARAVMLLTEGDIEGYCDTLEPTVPLARHIFRAPTHYYKTGVVFLAWLNGFQNHFVMLGGAQSMRSLPYFVDCFKMADSCGLLRKPELAAHRMKKLLSLYGA